jgi:hypothetical protein
MASNDFLLLAISTCKYIVMASNRISLRKVVFLSSKRIIMKPIFIFSIAFFCVIQTKASKVIASSFGYNDTDATAAFQAAIQSNYDTIVIDKQNTDWKVAYNHFFDLTERVIIFESGVILRAIPGAFPEPGHCLFRMVRCQDITIIGYQAEFIMNKPEYVALNDSEYRHCLHIDNCLNIKVFGLTLRDSGGDGVYVGGADYWNEPRTYSENIWLEDLRCINNYRQGLSICSVENMMVTHCQFSETKGTLPEAGIDIEPFEPYQRIVNLTLDHCVFTKNAYAGLAVALVYMDSTSLPVSIKVQDCFFSQNCRPGHPYGPTEIMVGADNTKPVQGSVVFERCVVDSSQWTVLYTRKTDNAFGLKFKDCVFKDVSMSQSSLYNNPIFLEVPDYDNPSASLGGINFEDVFLSYSTNYSMFRVYGWSTLEGIKNIKGNLTVLAPQGNPPLYENVQDTTNVTLSYSLLNALPPTSINWQMAAAIAYECTQQMASFQTIRSSSQLNYPLLVRYTTSGIAKQGDDIHLPTSAVVIEANKTIGYGNIIARNDAKIEGNESVLIAPLPSAIYSNNSTNVLEASVLDCLQSKIEEQNELKSFEIMPNPVSDFFEIKTDITWKIAVLYNEIGQKVKEFSPLEKMSLYGLESGIYFLEVLGKHKSQFLKIVKE